jgi:hypothetical protein
MNASRLLSIYLRDHHAGAVAGVNLARRVASQNEGTAYAEELADLAAEIEEDRRTLESAMDRLDVGRDQLKDLAALAGEKLGRLKPNGRWREYSPLSRLVELEALVLGVSAKLGLWRSLRETVGEAIDGIELATLEARAESQRARLEGLRLRAAGDALGDD